MDAALDLFSQLAVPLSLEPMEAKATAELPREAGWRFEPKWDGFRCLAFRSGGAVELRAKSGKPLGRYFPEMVEALGGLSARRFVLDGELVVEPGGAPSFDALQMRLHPVESRVRKLARETPSVLVVFDLLVDEDGASLIERPLSERRAELERFVKAVGAPPFLRLSPFTESRKTAQGWLARIGVETDGVVAKRADGPYEPGERAMLKIKRLRTADCVVGGFRYAQGERLAGSLLLGLYDEAGLLNHVGFTSTIPRAERPELTRRLEALAEGPGFTGKAPGGPSRWSEGRDTEWTPLRPELVVEVRFDHVTAGRFRHGTKLLRWRPDKKPASCTMDQLYAPVAEGR
jgi:ATP-dependent DNA ligase